jgi:hypothetical protein
MRSVRPILLALALTSTVLVLLTGCSKSPASSEQTAESVVKSLKATGLPIDKILVLTAETDTNKFLGKPNQHISKASWTDSRINTTGNPGMVDGGTVEVFLTEADLKKRIDYVALVTKNTGAVPEYSYWKRLTLVRLSKNMSHEQAADYDKALQTLY